MIIKICPVFINYYRDGYQDFSCVCTTFYKQDTGSFVSLNVDAHVSVDDSDSWISSHIYYIPIDWTIVNGTLFHVYYIQLKMQTFYCKSYRRIYGSYSYVVPIVYFHGNESYSNDIWLDLIIDDGSRYGVGDYQLSETSSYRYCIEIYLYWRQPKSDLHLDFLQI